MPIVLVFIQIKALLTQIITPFLCCSAITNFPQFFQCKIKISSILCNSIEIEVTLAIIFIASILILTAILISMLVNSPAIILAPILAYYFL